MKIVCTGSIAFDTLMTFPGTFKEHIIPEHLETLSLSFLVDSLVRHRGGAAPNIAYTIALLGGKPLLMGTAGKDFGEYQEWLVSQNVDVSHVKVIQEEYTASFYANTDLTNSQICSFYTGAMRFASELSIHDLEPDLPDLVIISPNDPIAMDKYAQECVTLGVPYLYDPGQQVARSSPEELQRGAVGATSLFVNEYEYQLIQKHTGLREEDFLGRVKFMVVTLGQNGAAIYADGEKFTVPVVPPEKILDPTGVGDAFRGGFLRGYELGLDWETCGKMGSLAATYCLEQRGTSNHTYTPDAFVARYRKHFDDQGALDVLMG